MSETISALRPPTHAGLIACIADSSLLFSSWWKSAVLPAVEATRKAGLRARQHAAYFGATSYDKREYFEIFKAAASELGFRVLASRESAAVAANEPA